MNDSILDALKSFLPYVLPEALLALAACLLFLGATWKVRRHVWGVVALAALAGAGVALAWTVTGLPPLEDRIAQARAENDAPALELALAEVYAAPVTWTRLAIFFKVVALVTGAVLVLLGWDEGGDEHAGEYHACLLLIVAGTGLVGSANELITLFLALELISIPTYVLLYLPRADAPAQEAAMKYFLLSVFSSALLLFGFSYLYGVAGTTNVPAILDELARVRDGAGRSVYLRGMSLIALVMVVAGLGFRITAVPFHFYAPDVYQGTTAPSAALLSFVPKVVGFAAMVRLLGFVPDLRAPGGAAGLALGDQVPVLLWIMAAVTMTLGNVLAVLQDNMRRMLAYSSVAHAGYMLIGLAVAPRLVPGAPGAMLGGVEALLFYLVAYGAMTVGAFAVLHYLSTPERPVETVDDLAGLSRSHPGTALVMLLFLLSLIGIPLTAGFSGKFLLFWEAMGLNPPDPTPTSPLVAGLDRSKEELVKAAAEQFRLYRALAIIGALNAAIGAYYYLRMASAMYFREAIDPLPPRGRSPALGTIAVCAALTVGLAVPTPLTNYLRKALNPAPAAPAQPAAGAGKALARN